MVIPTVFSLFIGNSDDSINLGYTHSALLRQHLRVGALHRTQEQIIHPVIKKKNILNRREREGFHFYVLQCCRFDFYK